MNKRPLISIIIPTYNQENLISDAIESVLMQDYDNFEIIIADDCSTDNTKNIVNSYTDPRIKYYKNSTNLGRVKNYHNALYNLTNGEWVLNLDGDDFFTDNTYLSSAVNALNSFNDDNIVLISSNRHICKHNSKHKDYLSSNAINTKPYLYSGNEYILLLPKPPFRIYHVTSLYKKDYALQIGFYNQDIISTDLDSLYRLIVNKYIIRIECKTAAWRSHANNISTNKNIIDTINNYNLIVNIYNYIKVNIKKNYNFNRWLNKNIKKKYYNDILSYLEKFDLKSIIIVDRYIHKRFPIARLLTLLNIKLYFKILFSIIITSLKRVTRL
jgi:glycosyltransferase involved in cell wall biosynthesis